MMMRNGLCKMRGFIQMFQSNFISVFIEHCILNIWRADAKQFLYSKDILCLIGSYNTMTNLDRHLMPRLSMGTDLLPYRDKYCMKNGMQKNHAMNYHRRHYNVHLTHNDFPTIDLRPLLCWMPDSMLS